MSAAYPATVDLAILRFATVSKDRPAGHEPFFPAFLAGYMCAATEVPVTLKFGYCGTHQDSFRVGHREGSSMLELYKRDLATVSAHTRE